MITNTVQSPEFNTMLARCTQAETPSEFEAAKARLAAFIDGWGAGLQHKAVEEFKAVCKFQGLVACDEKALDAVRPHLIPRIASVVFDAVKRDTFDTNLKVPKDLTPTFNVPDEDLNMLLNDTAFLVTGDGNMDTALQWREALEKVQARLQPVEVERCGIAYGITRYRIHGLIHKAFGTQVLKAFKQGTPIIELLDPELTAKLLQAIEAEFKCSIPANVRQQMIAGTGEQLVETFYDVQDACAVAEPQPPVLKLLDRLDVEQKLSAVARKHFSQQQWAHFQNTDCTFEFLVEVDDKEYDDWSDFQLAVEDEFVFRFGLDTKDFIHKTYVQVVDFIIERMKK